MLHSWMYAVARGRDGLAARGRGDDVPRVRRPRAGLGPGREPRRRGRPDRDDDAPRVEGRRAATERDAREVARDDVDARHRRARHRLVDEVVLADEVVHEVAEEARRRQPEAALEVAGLAVAAGTAAVAHARVEVDEVALPLLRRRVLDEGVRVVGARRLVYRAPQVLDLQRAELVVPPPEPPAALVENAHARQHRARRRRRAPLLAQVRLRRAAAARHAAETAEKIARIVRCVVEQSQEQREPLRPSTDNDKLQRVLLAPCRRRRARVLGGAWHRKKLGTLQLDLFNFATGRNYWNKKR